MDKKDKPNAKIYELRVNNIKGIEVFEHKFEDGVPCVVYGKNGSGKSSILDGLLLALKGRKGTGEKIDNPVGPYSTGAVKKGSVDIRIKADPGATELGEDLFIHFGVTESGTVSLKITDEKTGKVHKSSPREKVEKLLGLFLDPVDLKKTLDYPHGDSKLAEKICEMSGFDLQTFVEKEFELFQKYQDENKEVSRLQNDFDSLDVPQDDWATEFTDPVTISNQIKELNDLKSRNEQRVWNIVRSHNELDQVESDSKRLAEEITEIDQDGRTLTHSLNIKISEIDKEKESFELFKSENKPLEWEGTKNIEEEIRRLTEELTQLRTFEEKEAKKKQAIDIKMNEIKSGDDKIEFGKKEIADKKDMLEKKNAEKSNHDQVVMAGESKVERAHDENKMEPWTGDKAPDKSLFPLVFLTEMMDSVTAKNTEFEARKSYDIASSGLVAAKKSLDDVQKSRKVNRDEKAVAVANAKDKFPHPGITVDMKKEGSKEITVWVDMDDRRGKRTINDLSEGEKLMICTHILIAGNTGVLDVLIVRDGSSLDSDNRQIIYDIAGKHGYTVMLETIETSEVGALHIVEGRVDSINQPKDSDAKKVVDEKPVEPIIDNESTIENKDTSGINW